MAINNATNSQVTQYNVITGAASNALNNVAPSATSGVPLISQGSSAQPTFGTAVVAGGGTGLTSTTAYAVLCGGTTSTGALQSIASGNAGQVLQSNGNSALPTWSTPTYPSVSATSRKMLVSNGTNFVASTETWATPGTSGNILTSDGTNWTSSALSEKSYSLQMMTAGSAGALADGSTYFFRYGVDITSSTTSGGASLQRIYIPKTGTITQVYGAFGILSTLGSSENVALYIRKNNTTDTAISTSIQLNANPTTFNNTSIALAVTQGDYIEFKMVNPVWATNPSQVFCTLTVFIA